MEGLRTSDLVYRWSTITRITDMLGELKGKSWRSPGRLTLWPKLPISSKREGLQTSDLVCGWLQWRMSPTCTVTSNLKSLGGFSNHHQNYTYYSRDFTIYDLPLHFTQICHWNWSHYRHIVICSSLWSVSTVCYVLPTLPKSVCLCADNQFFLACIARRTAIVSKSHISQSIAQFDTQQDLSGKISIVDTGYVFELRIV